MLKLATLVQNPGEPAVESRYADPRELAALGYTGVVFFEASAVSGLIDPAELRDADERRWVEAHVAALEARLAAADAAGLESYLAVDAATMPRDVSESAGVDAVCCAHRLGVVCPASSAALAQTVAATAAWLKRWPGVRGVVLRTGDTDAGRLPYLVGNDVYTPRCERCRGWSAVDRVAAVVDAMADAVVRRAGRRLIVRAWHAEPGGLHDTPELVRELAARLPADGAGGPKGGELVLSFKFSAADFWRHQPWNTAMFEAGDWPVLVELSCQREYEAKGAVPNWQAPLWRDGMPEVQAGGRGGLASVMQRADVAGVMAWVRGGGWGGPHPADETWIDADAWAAPRLLDEPKLGLNELLSRWIDERVGGLPGALASALGAVLRDSTDLSRQTFYVGAYAATRADHWQPGGGVTRDDILDAEALRRVVERLSVEEAAQAVAEKDAAARGFAEHRAALQRLVPTAGGHAARVEAWIGALAYGESLARVQRELIAGLAAHRVWATGDAAGEAGARVRRHLLAAQSHWNHHTQRLSSFSGAATPFREEGLWELTQDLLAEVDA